MKSTIGSCIAVVMLVGMVGLGSAYASNMSPATHKKAVEVTGCLQQGPVAKEFLLHAEDGTVWGVNEADMYINHYVGHTVTVVGDAVHPTAAERTEGGAQHYLKAMDLMVESSSCQKSTASKS